MPCINLWFVIDTISGKALQRSMSFIVPGQCYVVPSMADHEYLVVP